MAIVVRRGGQNHAKTLKSWKIEKKLMKPEEKCPIFPKFRPEISRNLSVAPFPPCFEPFFKKKRGFRGPKITVDLGVEGSIWTP